MKRSVMLLTGVLTAFSINSAFAKGGSHHYPGIFVGMTHVHDETDFTYGIEYEYKFDNGFGLGAVYEKTNNAYDGDGVTVKLLGAFYHPTDNVRIGVGFGEEKVGGYHPHTEDLYRISANYDFHVGDFGIAPTVAVDFIDGEEAFVLGVAFVRPF